jgi:hypothetical protein
MAMTHLHRKESRTTAFESSEVKTSRLRTMASQITTRALDVRQSYTALRTVVTIHCYHVQVAFRDSLSMYLHRSRRNRNDPMSADEGRGCIVQLTV